MADLFVLTPVGCRRFTDDRPLQAGVDPKCPCCLFHFPVSFWLLLRPIMHFSNDPSSSNSRRQRFLKQLWGSLSERWTRQTDASRNRLQLEPLEKRQLLAGDLELLFTEPTADLGIGSDANEVADAGLQAVGIGEGEAADDLVQSYSSCFCGKCRTQFPTAALSVWQACWSTRG